MLQVLSQHKPYQSIKRLVIKKLTWKLIIQIIKSILHPQKLHPKIEQSNPLLTSSTVFSPLPPLQSGTSTLLEVSDRWKAQNPGKSRDTHHSHHSECLCSLSPLTPASINPGIYPLPWWASHTPLGFFVLSLRPPYPQRESFDPFFLYLPPTATSGNSLPTPFPSQLSQLCLLWPGLGLRKDQTLYTVEFFLPIY